MFFTISSQKAQNRKFNILQLPVPTTQQTRTKLRPAVEGETELSSVQRSDRHSPQVPHGRVGAVQTESPLQLFWRSTAEN